MLRDKQKVRHHLMGVHLDLCPYLDSDVHKGAAEEI